MRRTQLYLDDDMWEALHIQSRQKRTTVSELVRRAVREKYVRTARRGGQAMKGIVGMWADRPDIRDAESYVRKLRRGQRRKPSSP